MKRTVTAERGVKPAGPYFHATVADGFVFVSGQGPFDPETNSAPDAFADQVRQTFENLRVVLEAAGTSLDEEVKVNAYLTRFADFNEVYRGFFPSNPPARTRVATGLLGILVEIDCIAVIPRSWWCTECSKDAGGLTTPILLSPAGQPTLREELVYGHRLSVGSSSLSAA